MTSERHETEQDAHLRSSAARSRAAQCDTFDALADLSSCLRQKRVLALVSLVTSITTMLMAIILTIIIYGQ